MDVVASGADTIASGGSWVLGGCLGWRGRYWGWMQLVLISVLILVGGIGSGVFHIMAVDAPGAGSLPVDGA